MCIRDSSDTVTFNNTHIDIADSIRHIGDSDAKIRFPAADTFTVETAGSERLRIDSNGVICVKHTNALHSGNLQVATSGSDAIDINAYSSTAANGGRLTFYRSKNATIGSNTIVADNDSLGRIDFRGYNNNGNAYNIGATIEVEVDGAVDSATDMPSAIKFSTSTDGSSTPTERLRITSMGDIYAGNSDVGGYPIFDNSTTNPRFQFRQGTGTYRGFALIETRGDANSMALYIAKSREGPGTGVINSGDQLGSIQFTGADGTNQVTGAQILAYTSGTIAADRIPTNLSFYTHPDSTAGKQERLSILSDGAVNIGSSPAQATGSHTANAILTAKGYPGDQTSAAILALVRGNNTTSTAAGHTLGRIVFSDKQAGEYAMIEGEAEANGAVGDTPGRLIFATCSDGATTPSEKMRITESGKVGINVTSPDDTLDVSGTAQITSNTYVGGDLYMYGNSYGNGVFLGGSGSANKFDDYEFGTFTPTCAVETQSNLSLIHISEPTRPY